MSVGWALLLGVLSAGVIGGTVAWAFGYIGRSIWWNKLSDDEKHEKARILRMINKTSGAVGGASGAILGQVIIWHLIR